MFQKDLLQPIEQSHKWEVETLKQKLLDVFLTRVVKLPCARNNSSWMLQPLGSPVWPFLFTGNWLSMLFTEIVLLATKSVNLRGSYSCKVWCDSWILDSRFWFQFDQNIFFLTWVDLIVRHACTFISSQFYNVEQSKNKWLLLKPTVCVCFAWHLKYVVRNIRYSQLKLWNSLSPCWLWLYTRSFGCSLVACFSNCCGVLRWFICNQIANRWCAVGFLRLRNRLEMKCPHNIFLCVWMWVLSVCWVS